MQGSDIAGTYVHLSGRDTDQKILEINGLAKETERKEDELKPKLCPRCNALNAHSSNYCSKCSSILNTETALKEQEKLMKEEKVKTFTDELMNALMKDSDVQSLLSKKINELNLGRKIKKI